MSSREREEDNCIIKKFVKRFDKHKKRATLGMGEYYNPVMNCSLFVVHNALKDEWVIIPYHLCCTQKELQNSCTGYSAI